MGEYKAKSRDDKPSSNSSTANPKEKGGSGLNALGLPKPIANLGGKKLGKNGRPPGMPKTPGAPNKSKEKPKESEKQKESAKEKESSDAKKEKKTPPGLNNTKLGKAKQGIDQMKNLNTDDGVVNYMVNLVKALVVAVPAFVSLVPILLIIVVLGGILAVLSHYGVIDNLSQLKPLNPGTEDEQVDVTDGEISNMIFVGDSRTVGMYDAVNSKSTPDSQNLNVTDSNNVTWSAKVSMGYSWMESTGVPQIESKIVDNTGVIILMGINDMGNVNQYASYANKKAEEWESKSAKVFFVSVNPVSERDAQKYGYPETNTMIENFNKNLKAGLSSKVTYIDTYSSIKGDMEKGTQDGVHYTNDVYKKIYKLITSKVSSATGEMGPSNGKQGKYYAPVQTGNTNFKGVSSTPGCSNSVSHDLGGGDGSKLYAGMDGKAEYIQKTCNGVLASYGNEIKITASNGTYIIYAHLKSFVGVDPPVKKTCPVTDPDQQPCPASTCSSGINTTVVATKTVKKGQLVGYTGSTGNSTGAHLHVEIHENGSSSCVTDPWSAFGMR